MVEKVRKALNASVKLDFVEVRLKDVAEFLKDRCQIEIQLDSEKNSGTLPINGDLPINLNVMDMSLARRAAIVG